MTVVRPRLQWGVAELDGDRVEGFVEKPRSEHWINGGFFCFEPGVLGYLDEESVLEREPLRRLAADGQLRAHRHEGFWDCMDTYKDAVVLNDLWESGEAPLDGSWARERGDGSGEAGAGHRRPRVRRLAPGAGAAGARRRGHRPRPSAPPRPSRRPRRLQGIEAEVELVEGDLRDAEAVGATIGRAIRRRLPPRRADARRPGDGESRWRPSRPTCAAPGTCFEACRASRGPGGDRLASSDKAYGPSAELPYREELPLRPASPYEASKAAADVIALSYCPRLRTAGRGHPLRQRLRRRRPQLLPPDPGERSPPCSTAAGRQIRSDGSPERDFLHVDDAVAAYLAIEHAVGAGGPGAGEAFNAGGEQPALGAPRCSRRSPRSAGRGRRARVPRRRQPGRRDRPPVRRLLEAA